MNERVALARTQRWTGLCVGLLAALFPFLAPSAQAAETCPNAALRAENASLALPDCRAYELVSPIQKNGGAVQGFGANFGGDLLQAAADGEAATFSSATSFAAPAQGAPPAGQYLARRTASGWTTENLTIPALSGSYGDHPDGVPYRLFSPDLARGLVLNGERCRGPAAGECPVANPPLPGTGAPPGYQNYYLRDDQAGTFTALLTEANAALGVPPQNFELTLAGASPDLRHLVLSTCAALTSDATEQPNCESGGPNLYEWSGGELRLVNLLEGNAHGSSDAHLAAQGGAISADGSRIYFNQGEEASLYLREGEAGARPVSSFAGAAFQTASTDGRFAFFTDGGELFRYDAASDVSTPIATEVKGVLGASEDGATVFFQDAAGLQRWHEGAITQIAAGPQAAQPGDFPPATGTTRLSTDGETLLFLSSESLTGYDNADQASGKPDSEVYLYEAGGSGGGTLTCLSCNSTGERPLGPSSIPGAIANGSTEAYKPRVLSADGRRVFFDSFDRILPTDASSAADVYEWQAQGIGSCAKPGGCLALISAASGPEASSFVDASAEGRDVFFLTGDSLVPADPGSIDLYDAREAGGFPVPKAPIACDGDACQPLPAPPEDPSPGTLVPGLPNPPVHFPKILCPKGKPSAGHHRHHCGGKRHHGSHKRAGQK